MARILLGVSGGIAAYKALELARLATVAGHGVRVLMTEGADPLRRRRLLRGHRRRAGAHLRVRARPDARRLPRRPARPSTTRSATSSWPPTATPTWSRPASANTIAKLAAGAADSMLTTSFLACAAPRLVAPAMNDRMYADAATQANLETLRERGVDRDRARGGRARLARRARPGRLPDPARLLAAVEAALPAGDRPWDGLRVLVTAGGTREPIDPVRFLGNRSSGRMGIALAAAAARRGRRGDPDRRQRRPARARRRAPHRRRDGGRARRGGPGRVPGSHVLLMAAAPADFRAAEVAAGKLTRDGLAGAAPGADRGHPRRPRRARDEGQTIVGFAAEHGEGGVERARDKLQRKGADLIVLNDVSDPAIGFESEENAVTLIDRGGEDRGPKGSKDAIADAILDRGRTVCGETGPPAASGLY